MSEIYPDDIHEFSIFDNQKLAKNPLVTVMVLAFNHESYIKQAIDGILAQKVDFPIEILIGEDCSTDQTREISLEYQRRHPELIKIITADRNVGIQRNWQRLISASRGDFLAHLDGDDYWLPEKLRPQVEYLCENPDCAAVYTGAYTIDNEGKRTGLFNNVGHAEFDLAAMVRRGNFLNTSSMLFRSELRSSLLEIDELFIDYRVHLRLARHGILTQLGNTLTVYRVNATGSMTTTSNDLVRKLYWDAIMDVPEDCIRAHDRALGIADFTRRVLFRSFHERRWNLVSAWMPITLKASPYGTLISAFLVTGSVMHTIGKVIRHKLKSVKTGKPISILFYR